MGFDLDTSIAAWRRRYEHDRAFLPEDIRELERHVRDEVEGLVAEGCSEEEAFLTVMREMGEHEEVQGAYRDVLWGKLKRRHLLSTEIGWRLSMLKNYALIALRNLRRYRGYAFINVFGLAVGISVCLLLILLVQDQRSYDRFHEDADRIYRVIAEASGRKGRYGIAATPAYLSGVMERDVPGVEETLRLGRMSSNVIHGGRSFAVSGLYADPSFFEFFDFEVVSGSVQDALGQPNQLFLTEEAAARVFGTHDPIGEVVTLEGVGDLVVAGVVRTAGRKSHLTFDLLTSVATLQVTEGGRARLEDEADFWSFANYVMLEPGVSTGPLEEYLARTSERYRAYDEAYALHVQPLTGITLGPLLNNEIAAQSLPRFVVLMLAGIAGVVLLASGLNYVGLTVARSVMRAKEVGIRKTVGAQREQVVAQFLAESVLTALCALALAYALLAWLVPAFNGLSLVQQFRVDLSPRRMFDIRLVGVFLVFSVAVGLIAGAYPAFYLSKARPVLVLKGAGLGSDGSRMRLRRGLTFLQLAFALLFITTTALIYRQLTYMVSFDFGFHTEDVVNVELQGVPYATLKGELMRHPSVLAVGAADVLPASETNNGARVSANGRDTIAVSRYNVDAAFLDALDLKLVAGRGFSPSYAGRSEGVLINETAARLLGFERPMDATGQVVTTSIHAEPQTVLGVVEDFQFLQVARPIEPMLVHHDPEGFTYATVRLQPGATEAFLRHLEGDWKRLDPVHPLKYELYDAQIRDNAFTRFVRDVVKVVGFAAFIAITLACLGLMSMASFNARLRTKEVGIRKVLGASGYGLFWLLSKEYVLLTAVAAVVAAPIAWFLNRLWLEHIANRVSFGPLFVSASALTLLALAMLAVGSQTIRAALADPVESLRYE